MGQRLLIVIADNKAGFQSLDGPRRREAAGGVTAYYCLFLVAAGGAGRTSAHGSEFFCFASGRPLIVDS
jgi:hypothetical protein